MTVEQQSEAHLRVDGKWRGDKRGQILDQTVGLHEWVPTGVLHPPHAKQRAGKLELILAPGSLESSMEAALHLVSCEVEVVDRHAEIVTVVAEVGWTLLSETDVHSDWDGLTRATNALWERAGQPDIYRDWRSALSSVR